MADKKFYWIKLKTDFFNQDTIDFILQQENGCKYIVLYQMLCLKTANNNGELNTKIGEMIIPYDVEKIQRDTKYFDIDTVRVALELFKKLGLIYQQEDSILKISNFDDMVGSETKWAEKKRIYREKQKQLKLGQKEDNVREEIEYRDKSIEIEKDIDKRISTTIYDFIEENFGRTLSPIEYEEISKWEDNELTRYAIKQAVLNGKYNIKYISRILDSYKTKKIKTVQQAQQDEESFKKKKEDNKKTSREKIDEVFERFLNEEEE